MGICTDFFDPLDPDAIRAAVNEDTRLVFVENLANPALVVPDYETLSEVCRKFRVPLAVDNTIATPYLTNPLQYGADFVLHSCTKYMEGHGSILGGMVVDGGSFVWERERYPLLYEKAPGGRPFAEKFGPQAFLTRIRGKVLMNTGGAMAPFHAWLLLHGLESLHVRYPRHAENALFLAEQLALHPQVAWVNYPAFSAHPSHVNARRYFRAGHYGGMLGFGLVGGYAACKGVIDRIRLISHCTNIGDTKSLMIHPASTTHRNMPEADRLRAGIGNDFIRLSVGLENREDLWAALREAIRG